MSYYRDVYLKSEDWKNLRAAIIHFQDGLCECCGGKAKDVHHINYRNLTDVLPMDLMAVCRDCHDAIHLALKITPWEKINKKHKKAGLSYRGWVANHASPRGMVQFNVCFGPKTRKRITFHANGKRGEHVDLE